MKNFVAVMVAVLILVVGFSADAKVGDISYHLNLTEVFSDISPYVQLIEPYITMIDNGEELNEVEYATFRAYVELCAVIRSVYGLEHAQTFGCETLEESSKYTMIGDTCKTMLEMWDDNDAQYDRGEITYSELLQLQKLIANVITA